MINKIIIPFFCLFMAGSILNGYAQNNEGITNNTATSVLRAANTTQSAYGSSSYFYNPRIPVDGSEYLFDKWENRAVIYTKDKFKYVLKNINLNIKRNSFVSKVGTDSVFTFNMNNIDKIVINNKIYKSVFSEAGKRLYQVIYEDDEFSVLRGFTIQTVQSSPNPMVNRKMDRLVRKQILYIKKDNAVKRFSLSKRKVLGLVNKSNKEEVLRYTKTEKLSFRKEEDLIKILEYSDSL